MHRILAALICLSLSTLGRSDTLNLLNGDRFTGAVELVNAKEVHVQTESIGLVKIPREKVASIFFGTNTASTEIAAKTSGNTAFDEKAIQKVQQDFLATATPEANAMFTDLVQGLASGKLSLNDIRKQAQESLKELRELQAEVGEEDDNPLLAGYVGILEKFINQGSTNASKVAKPEALKPAAKTPKLKLDDDE